jgi:hypothetical protein
MTIIKYLVERISLVRVITLVTTRLKVHPVGYWFPDNYSDENIPVEVLIVLILYWSTVTFLG